MLKLRAQTTAFRLIYNTVLSGRWGLERPEMDTRGMTQNFCLVFIFILSDHCKILAILKTSTDIRSFVWSLVGFGVFFPLGKHVVFPSKFPAEKKPIRNKFVPPYGPAENQDIF